MIKGSIVAQLMNLSNQVSFILTKGHFKDFTTSEVVPLFYDAISLLDAASKEPSFSREMGSLLWELDSAKNLRKTLLEQGQRVIKGDEKQVMMGKVQIGTI